MGDLRDIAERAEGENITLLFGAKDTNYELLELLFGYLPGVVQLQHDHRDVRLAEPSDVGPLVGGCYRRRSSKGRLESRAPGNPAYFLLFSYSLKGLRPGGPGGCSSALSPL
jgi:hypothetical protein